MIIETLRNAFTKEDIPTIIKLWVNLEISEKEKFRPFLKILPSEMLDQLIDRIRTLNEYIADDIMVMTFLNDEDDESEEGENEEDENEEDENEEEENEKMEEEKMDKLEVEGKEYTAEEIVEKCKEEPSFLKKAVKSAIFKKDQEFITSFMLDIMKKDMTFASSINEAIEEVKENILKGGIDMPEELPITEKMKEAAEEIRKKFTSPKKAIEEKIEEIFASPEKFVEFLQNPENREKIFKTINNSLSEVCLAVSYILNTYKDEYIALEKTRYAIVQSKAKVLGVFATTLAEQKDISSIAIDKLLAIELEKMNRRFQLI